MNAETSLQLFAVYLGGKAPRCNIELHDVVFAVGNSIEDTYRQLMESWFGSLEGLHIDSWLNLKVVDGYSVRLGTQRIPQSDKLFFINLGAYEPGKFTELHANAFLVAQSEKDVIVKAKDYLLKGMKAVHTDNLYDVDDCLEISKIGDYFIELTPTNDVVPLEPVNAYRIIPKAVVAQFKTEKVRSP